MNNQEQGYVPPQLQPEQQAAIIAAAEIARKQITARGLKSALRILGEQDVPAVPERAQGQTDQQYVDTLNQYIQQREQRYNDLRAQIQQQGQQGGRRRKSSRRSKKSHKKSRKTRRRC